MAHHRDQVAVAAGFDAQNAEAARGAVDWPAIGLFMPTRDAMGTCLQGVAKPTSAPDALPATWVGVQERCDRHLHGQPDERTLMLDDASDDDIRCQQLRQDNAALLGDFSRRLKKAGLGAATIRSHCTNLDFYLNHFLLYADTLTPADGVAYVGEFLGDWFIHKAMWSNKTTIKANAASLKKFYAFMAERKLIKPEEFASLKQQIKDELPEWLGAVERYNDPNVDFEDVWPAG